jgi:hypothetical protein
VFVKKQIRVAEEKKNDHFSYKCNVSIVVVFFFLILHNFMLSWVSKYVTLKENRWFKKIVYKKVMVI